MRYEVIGRGLRVLRHRRGLRQADLAARSGVSRSVIGDLEHGRLEPHALGALVRTAGALGGVIRITLSLPGGDLERLLDADHAALCAGLSTLLVRHGWEVEAEATFNHYGERGSLDVLAWHPETSLLLVVEVKTILVDLQDLLAGIDRKVRVARTLAAARGWEARATVPMLVVAEGATARRLLDRHAALFTRFTVRGHATLRWLRTPALADVPRGLLLFTKSSPARRDGAISIGRQRIRRRTVAAMGGASRKG